jgi:hypothetical protein
MGNGDRRAALGEEAFRATWLEDQALPLKQALPRHSVKPGALYRTISIVSRFQYGDQELLPLLRPPWA